jgi:hypothetical protein
VSMAIGPADRPDAGKWRCDGSMGHSRPPLDSIGLALGAFDALTWATRYARTPHGQNAVFTQRRMEK